MPPRYEQREKPHIEKRRNGLLVAVMDVPTGVTIVGKKGRAVRKLTETLRTRSLAVAEKKAAVVIARWRRQIDKARGEHVETAAEFYRRIFTEAELREIQTVGDHAYTTDQAGVLRPVPAGAETALVQVVETVDGKTSERFHHYVVESGERYVAHITEWISGGTLAPKSRHMAESTVREFAQQFPMLKDVSKAAVKRWASALIEGGQRAKTVDRKLWALRSYWRHLQAIEIVSADLEPFAGLNMGKQSGRVKRSDRRQAFEAADVLRMLRAAHRAGDDELRDLILLGMWTGARIEELCSLRVADVKLTANVPHYAPGEGKTGSAIREVPIHRKLAPVLRRLIGERREGYVFADLTKNKFGDRSNAIGKRFGRLARKEGFGKEHVFHSIRKCVAALYKAAHIEESIAADIIGHDHPSMTFGLYAGAADLATKAAAVAKLAYSPAVKDA